jgi:hypothetical protein
MTCKRLANVQGRFQFILRLLPGAVALCHGSIHTARVLVT